jgi:hypothetical protein
LAGVAGRFFLVKVRGVGNQFVSLAKLVLACQTVGLAVGKDELRFFGLGRSLRGQNVDK